MTAADSEIIERTIRAGRALAAAGQQDMVWGHVALRDPDGRGVWMKASGWGYDEITPERVVLVGWDGSRLHGDGKVHIESHIHLEIMAARGDVTASVHAHPEAVNAFSALEVPLRAISHDGVPFADPQIPRTGLSGDLVFDAKRGRTLAADLGSAPACLMPRHGLVAVGPSEAHAVMHAVLLDHACSAQLRAQSAGEITSYSDSTEVAEKLRHAWPDSQIEAGYAFLLRQAGF
ncbi:class II aldolase/adducin family protein [Herbiconiux liukaitaii]|uniref:class II aldolase/adducin family protein n=1 Tax=Herbiconiux liukaitaii TaxID=3342799 RepID=UPI0035B6FA31